MPPIWIAVDVETTGLDFTRDTITSLAFFAPSLPSRALTEKEEIRAWLEEHKDDFFVFHNGKFDVKAIWKEFCLPVRVAWDTLLAESILPDRPDKLDLQTCVAKELGYPPWKEKLLYQNIGNVDKASVQTLALSDVKYTYELFLKQVEKLKQLNLENYFLKNNLGVRTLNFLAEVEYRGIGLNYDKMQELWKKNLIEHEILCKNLYERYKSLVVEYENAEFAKHPLCPPKPGAKESTLQRYQERLKSRIEKYKFNFGSPKQVTWLLTKKFNFPCKNVEGKVSTSQDVLEFYRGQQPIIDELLQLRHNEHDSSAFFQNWHDYYREGRLHPSYRMDIAKTYRLSCSEPALQQVKRESGMRELFIPEHGMRLAVVDYSQIEPRLIAHYSEDSVLKDIYTNNLDLYETVARVVMGYTGPSDELKNKYKDIRSIAKEIALSSFYGIGPDKFAHRVRYRTGRQITVEQARHYIDSYFNLLSGVRHFKVNLANYLEKTPMLTTILGRTLFFKPGELYHLAFNKLIQCTGSDINLFSQVDLDLYFKNANMQARCIHLVHDEALFQYPQEEEGMALQAIKYYMADRYSEPSWGFRVPIKVDIKTGQNWGCK